MPNYEIKDISLAPEGARKINWVRENMPILYGLEQKYTAMPDEQKRFQGLRVCLCMHLEAKTAYLGMVFAAAGADVAITGSNVLSTQDAIAAALAADGYKVFAVHGESDHDYYRHLEMCLEHKPHIIIDDGADLTTMLHTKRQDLIDGIWGGCEETTTGIIRLKALEKDGILRFPMLAVNDAKCKHLFDNRYGTGQSVLDSIMRNTNLIIASKTVVVAGYGWCGKGLALRAAALGAKVIVTEIDPVKAIEARMDGYDVMPMICAAPLGDIFITATGCREVITDEHMVIMKDGAILTNAGHFDVEVDMAGLRKLAKSSYEARENVTAYELPGGRKIHVIGEGRLVNIAAADGHPAEIMDLSFAVQFYSALYVLDNHEQLDNAVLNVSDEIDNSIARERLTAWGVEIDELTGEQEKYLNSWQL